MQSSMTTDNKKRNTQRIVVTGGSGKLGRACVQDLLEHGYEVINADIFPSEGNAVPF